MWTAVDVLVLLLAIAFGWLLRSTSSTGDNHDSKRSLAGDHRGSNPSLISDSDVSKPTQASDICDKPSRIEDGRVPRPLTSNVHQSRPSPASDGGNSKPSPIDANHDPKPSSGNNSDESKSSPRKTVFRVRGVPNDWDRVALEFCLTEDSLMTGPSIQSLAKEIHGRSQTATVSFQKVPEAIQTAQSKGSLEISLSQGLVLDTHFHGVTTLYVPPSPDYKVDVIAISGLGGHAFGSFKQRSGEHMWLRDALPHHITEEDNRSLARVMIYGYDSRLSDSNNFQNLDDLAKSFYDSFLVLTNGRTFRPIIILAHSLGGLIVKQALISLSIAKDEGYQALFQAMYGIVFFGVPNHGMDISSLKPMVDNRPNRFLLESIGPNSQVLGQQYGDFQKALAKGMFEVVCFYEMVESPTAVQGENGVWKMEGPPAILVAPESATHCRHWEEGEQYKCPINRTHSEMVKFGPQDAEYEKVLQRVKRIVQKAPFCAKTPIQPRLSPKEQECLHSLAFSEMNDRANEIDLAVEGTCKWLLEHEDYTAWKASTSSLLWIKGKPGSGKSTLLKYALKNQEASARGNDLVLSFFFHGRGADLQKNPFGFFRSLLHQLLSRVPAALSSLVETFQKRCETIGQVGKWQWHEKELWEFFQSSLPAVVKYHSVWIFVDALDECGQENAKDLIAKFNSLLKTLQPSSFAAKRFHLCFACRPYPVQAFKGNFEIYPEKYNGGDIATFVEAQEFSPRLQAAKIPTLITSRASGVFMWARLTAERVKSLELEGAGLRKTKDEIASIPEELDALYDGLVKGMEPDSTKLIHWICFATRPLSMDELRWAMVIDADCPYRSLQACQSAEDVLDNDQLEKRIQTLSRGLAEFTSSSDTQVVQFIHQSVSDYFLDKGLLALNGNSMPTELVIGRAHFQLSRSCIHYLAMEEIALCKLDEVSAYDLKFKFPLIHYATTSLVPHIKQIDDQGIPQEDLFDSLSDDFLRPWTRIYRSIEKYSNNRPQENITLIHIAARYGILGLLNAARKSLSEYTTSINSITKDGRTALSLAAENGQEAMVKLLLETGQVDVNSKDTKYGQTPLSWAAENGQEAVVKLLLETGQVDVDSKDTKYGQTPLSLAAEYGQEAIVKLLLKTGQVDVNSKDTNGWTPLSWAASRGQEAVVKLLLKTGQVDVDSKDTNGWTPLLWAAKNGREAVVELLQRYAMDS